MRKRLTIAVLIAVSLSLIIMLRNYLKGDSEEQTPDLTSVFAQPRVQVIVEQTAAEIMKLFDDQKYEQAEQMCAVLIQLRPNSPGAYYNLACAQSRLGKLDAAVQALRHSVTLGFRDEKHMQQDPDLENLRKRPEWKDLSAAAKVPLKADNRLPSVTRAKIENGEALIAESNTGWDAQNRLLRVFFSADVNVDQTKPLSTGESEADELLRSWDKDGTAAGFVGVVYDNRDRGHSLLNPELFPRLARTRYSKPARDHNVDNGLQAQIYFEDLIVIGNSSTAHVNGPMWRSQARFAITSAAVRMTGEQYFNNHIYFYPEHRDFDSPEEGGKGDVFTANVPYYVVSKGSSFTDKPFIESFASALAALRPEVRAKLKEKSALIPTLQTVFRQSNAQVQKPEDYLTGTAHPPVFRGDQLNRKKMVERAHALTVDSLPPVCLLRVTREEVPVPGRDYFEPGLRERSFTTPAAIARVCHGVQQKRRMEVTALQSFDPDDNLKLTWKWVVLQGDPERVSITLDESTASAVIEVSHHEPRPIAADGAMESSRVDIGVFAHDGIHYSAPALISFYWPENQKRSYDADGQITKVVYTSEQNGGPYCDPRVVSVRDWTDEYNRDAAGQLAGWTRTQGDSTQRFSAQGHLITETDAQGRADVAVAVNYLIENVKGLPMLRMSQTTRKFRYAYESEQDLIGTPTEIGAEQETKGNQQSD